MGFTVKDLIENFTRVSFPELLLHGSIVDKVASGYAKAIVCVLFCIHMHVFVPILKPTLC